MSIDGGKLEVIKQYVLAERKSRGITRLTAERKSEMSGEAFGEFVMLLERQLLTTPMGMGAWSELEDDEVLDGVFREVLKSNAPVRSVSSPTEVADA